MPRDLMPAPTGPTNQMLVKQIEELRAEGRKEKSNFMLKIADELERPERIRKEVDLSRIERFASKGETVIVPGKLLADGILTKGVTIAAWSSSDAAKKKVEKAGGKVITITELIKKNPKGTKVKIIG